MGDWVCGPLKVCGALREMVLMTEVGTDTGTLGPPEADWRQHQAPCLAVPGHWPPVVCQVAWGIIVSQPPHSVGQGMAAP